jgi:predicted flap endonuclease-1-like 5' DNA nuclease
MDHLPLGLALCIVPFILGWLAAYAFYGVPGLRSQVKSLTEANASLEAKVKEQSEELTELRVKITQLESELEGRDEKIRKMRNELIICESERNNLKIAMEEGGGSGGKKASKATTIMFAGKKWKQDDLKIVEGIGPKISDLLNKDGINTWEDLSNASVDRLKGILDAAGPSFQIHDPGSWPRQAGMAAKGQWDELKKWQDELDGGR